MTDEGFINILVAEDNEVSRELMASVFRAEGYRVYGAVDGESAITVVTERPIDLAFVDINMAPKGGLEFVRHLVAQDNDMPVVIVTADESSHVLLEATALGVAQVLQKPIDPKKLVQTAHRILKRRGLNPQPLAVTAVETRLAPQDLMNRALVLAERNARMKYGGPFGAVIADAEGKIIGEGVSGVSGRADPVAHAEVMAVRQAAEKLGKSDLSDCVLYCACEPTAVGKALIESVGIKTVYYALDAADLGALRRHAHAPPAYKRLGRDEALRILKN